MNKTKYHKKINKIINNKIIKLSFLIIISTFLICISCLFAFADKDVLWKFENNLTSEIGENTFYIENSPPVYSQGADGLGIYPGGQLIYFNLKNDTQSVSEDLEIYSNFAISFWLNNSDDTISSGTAPLIEFNDDVTTEDAYLFTVQDSGNIHFFWRDTIYEGIQDFDMNIYLNESCFNQWCKIELISEDGSLTSYVDSVETNTVSKTVNLNYTNINDMEFVLFGGGCYSTSCTTNLVQNLFSRKLAIDELRIYNLESINNVPNLTGEFNASSYKSYNNIGFSILVEDLDDDLINVSIIWQNETDLVSTQQFNNIISGTTINASLSNTLINSENNISITYQGTDGFNTTDAFESSILINETFACEDLIDNDADGFIDFPNDPGCNSSIDDSEFNEITGYSNTYSTNDVSNVVIDIFGGVLASFIGFVSLIALILLVSYFGILKYFKQ